MPTWKHLVPPGRLRLHDVHRQQRPAARAVADGGQGETGGRGGAQRQPQFRRPHASAGAARIIWRRRRWWWPTRSPARWTSTCTNEPLGTIGRQAGLPARHLADHAEIQEAMRRSVDPEMFQQQYARGLRRRRQLEDHAGAGRRHLQLGREVDLHQEPAVLRRHAWIRRRHRRICTARACWRCSAIPSRPITSRPPGRHHEGQPRRHAI